MYEKQLYLYVQEVQSYKSSVEENFKIMHVITTLSVILELSVNCLCYHNLMNHKYPGGAIVIKRCHKSSYRVNQFLLDY